MSVHIKKTNLALLVSLFFSAAIAMGQNALPGNGNVGIGTTAPFRTLHVQAPLHNEEIRWDVVVQNPANNSGAGYGAGLRFQNSIFNAGPLEENKWAGVGAIAGAAWSSRTDLVFFTSNASSSGNYPPPSEKMRILGDSGNVGIGTTNPSHKLAVNGTVKAKEVIVETNWSDYVFADDYALASLPEVEAHIKQHKHLPGIPSAAQVAEQGVSVGDMQAKLLAKIEELTLHQIAQEKELAALRTKVARLEGAAR